jgi:hypothetical protein
MTTSTNGTATTDATPRAKKAKPFTGFGVVCPECSNPDGTVRMNLNDLSGCTCSECDWGGSPAEAIELIQVRLAAWQHVARWVELAPTVVVEG